MRWRCAALLCAVALAGCAGSEPVPQWQVDAKAASEAAVDAYLSGATRVAAAEFARARGQLARTGRPDLLARAELLRCAAAVASLDFEPCAGFEALRADAAPAERAYADYLVARLPIADAALLPPAQRPFASGTLQGEPATAALRAIDDPLSRLVAAAVLFKGGRADPQAVALAVETASAQGWRRPLLAWLGVELALAEKAGNKDEVERLRRRIAAAQSGGA
jgi:hypothetical protein